MKNKLVIASHNNGKIKEIKNILEPFNFELLSSKDFKLKEPEENGNSFEENAIIKSSFTAKNTGYVSLSDDSGLCIDELNGYPGIFSARLAGKNKDFDQAMKILKLKLKNKKNTKCKFVCALSLCWPDGKNKTVVGEIFGNFVWPPRGILGFGYDPIFQPLNHHQTFGELDQNYKHSISHRKLAFQRLKSEVKNFIL